MQLANTLCGLTSPPSPPVGVSTDLSPTASGSCSSKDAPPATSPNQAKAKVVICCGPSCMSLSIEPFNLNAGLWDWAGGEATELFGCIIYVVRQGEGGSCSGDGQGIFKGGSIDLSEGILELVYNDEYKGLNRGLLDAMEGFDERCMVGLPQ
jgi:hypothetical protein